MLYEVSESNTIVTGASENNTNKISKVPSEGHECAINEAYEHMVFWKKNNFRRLPNSAGKLFVDELTKLIDCWVSDSPSSTTALKSLILPPNLLLQKHLNKASNTISKEHLSIRLELWNWGKVNALLSEYTAIQDRLETSNSNNKIQNLNTSAKLLHILSKLVT